MFVFESIHSDCVIDVRITQSITSTAIVCRRFGLIASTIAVCISFWNVDDDDDNKRSRMDVIIAGRTPQSIYRLINSILVFGWILVSCRNRLKITYLPNHDGTLNGTGWF